MAAVADMNLPTPRPSLSMERDVGTSNTTNLATLNGNGTNGLVNGRVSHKLSASDGITSGASTASLTASGSGSSSTSTSATASPNTSSTLTNGNMTNGNETGGTAGATAPSPQPAQPIISFPELEGKQPAEQLEIMKELFEKASRVKEGAESFLRITPNLSDTARTRIVNELDQANAKLEVLRPRLETFAPRNMALRQMSTPASLSSNKSHSPSRSSGQHKKRTIGDAGHHHHHHHQHRIREDPAEREDLRAARQQMLGCIKSLLAFQRHQQHMSPSSSSASSSSAPPPPATEEELENARMESMNKLVEVFVKTPRVRFELNLEELVLSISPCLADSASTKARATAYRLLRYSLIDADSVERLSEHHLDWYIVKTLTRDNKCALERESALRLIRAVVELGSERHSSQSAAGLGRVPLSEPIMRALIAVAEHSEDPLRNICCETLLEIMLIDLNLIVRTGGLRVLLQAMADGPMEFAPYVATAFTYIVDSPKTRVYLHPGTDLELALSGITDAYGKGVIHKKQMQATAKVIATIMRSWSGLMYLCMDDMLAIRTLINTLRIPSLETREIILEMFFDLLNITEPEWHQTFIDGRRLTMYRRHRPPSQQSVKEREKEVPARSSDKLKLTDQYLSLLTVILAKAGLLEALTSMMEETTTGTALSRRAVLLMSEMLLIANKVLPLSTASRIQAIPRVFDLAADYSQNEHRIVGTSTLAAIDSFNRHRARLQPLVSSKDSRQRANSVEDPVRRGQRQVEQVKIKLALQMDDRAFQAAQLETQVTATKDHNRWNFDTLLDLIEGPLLNPKRMEEAIKVSKFIKRLMSFFHPFAHRFSDLKRVKANEKWVKLGCSVLTTLMASTEGVRYLMTEDEFLPQICRAFEQLRPNIASVDPDPIFSKKRVEETLTGGYLEMLGTLSKQKDGLELLEKFKIFSSFYYMSELRSREDLIKRIIENIDYSMDGHPRIVLSKALTSTYKHIRLYATRHLGQLIQTSPVANAWSLKLLLTQLYDPDAEVCELAVHILEEACDNPEILTIVVDMQPTLEHLGEVANSLLFKFMSTPVGFRYLYDVGFISREMDMWFNRRNLHYVVEVETYLSRELNSENGSEDFLEEALAFDGAVPPHFYGELAKTELGCEVLQEKGHFPQFMQFIRNHGLESDDLYTIHRLKSVLWAVGNIAAGEGGLHFLEEDETIPVVLEIAERSPVLTIRGTCFFVLGLISSTPLGAEILDDYGWEATLNPLGYPTGLCIPADLEKFIHISTWVPPSFEERSKHLIPPTIQEEVDILTAIANLANSVIANAASRSLAKMKSRPEFRAAFSSTTLFFRVLHIISTQRYRLPVRRFIMELFDVSLDADIVKEMTDCESSMLTSNATSSPKTSKLKPRVVSMFGRPTRGRGQSVSDGEDSDIDMGDEQEEIRVERPVSLRPIKRVTGFLGAESM